MSKTHHRRRKSPRGREHGDPQPHRVTGERAVGELVQADPGRIRRLLVDARRDFPELLARAQQAGIEPERVSADDLRDAAGIDARGIVAIATPPPNWPLDALIEHATEPTAPRPSVLLALDGVLDPQNLGAIMRTAEFFGAAGLLWARDRAVGLTPAVVRASAGASERIRLCVVTNLAAALRQCREGGLWIAGTVAEGGTSLAQMCTRGELPGELVLVMGSEERGLRRLTRRDCDFLVTVPRRGEVGSLNVGAATAVCLGMLTGLAGPPAEIPVQSRACDD